jgi:hypothetical protein
MLLIAVVPRRTTSSIAAGKRHDPLICRAAPLPLYQIDLPGGIYS